MKYKSIAAVLALLLASASSQAQPIMIKLVVEGGKEDYQNVPICVPLSFPVKADDQQVTLKDESGKIIIGQLTKPGLTTEHIKPKKEGEVRRDLRPHSLRSRPSSSISISTRTWA